MISLFGLNKSFSISILKDINLSDKVFIGIGPKPIDKYLKYLQEKNPQYIIGVGKYGRKSNSYLKIETQCNNMFRGNLIDYSYKKIHVIENATKSNEKVEYSHTMGNSYCNYVSFKIMDMISKKIIKSKYIFLHVPYNQRQYASKELLNIIKSIDDRNIFNNF